MPLIYLLLLLFIYFFEIHLLLFFFLLRFCSRFGKKKREFLSFFSLMKGLWVDRKRKMGISEYAVGLGFLKLPYIAIVRNTKRLNCNSWIINRTRINVCLYIREAYGYNTKHMTTMQVCVRYKYTCNARKKEWA